MARSGLPGWIRRVYLQYNADARLHFYLAPGLGEPWTREGGIPGCPLNLVFTVALSSSLLPELGKSPWYHSSVFADNPLMFFLLPIQYTTHYVPAPGICSRKVRDEKRAWVTSDDGVKWLVQHLDVWELGVQLALSLSGWAPTSARLHGIESSHVSLSGLRSFWSVALRAV